MPDLPHSECRSILPAKTVDQRCGMTPALRWREEKSGRFPRRIQITPFRVGYYEDEISAWIASRPRKGADIDTPISPGRLGKRGAAAKEAA